MSTVLLVNPAAGRGRAGRVREAALAACRAQWPDTTVLETTAPGGGVALARQAVDQGAERVLVLGGDGTVHEAANGILTAGRNPPPPLGVIPVGTGNDYAKLVNVHGLGVAEAVRRLAAARVVRLDAGHAWGEYFINAVGAGFDAEVARRVNGFRRLEGTPAYLLAVFEAFASFRPPNLRVESEELTFEEPLMLIEIGIGDRVGGGFRLTPDARPDDGLFDVCAIRALKLGSFLLKLPLAMLGRHRRLREVRMFRTAALTVTATDGELVAQFDGELRRRREPLVVTIERQRLPVLIP